MKNLFKNISYTLLGNLISLVIATMVTFVLPKVLDVEPYSYFQLYLFYISYTGFLHFGWADGIFLRYGGDYYEKLDKAKFSGQFWLFTAFEALVSVLLCAAGYFLVEDSAKSLVLVLTGVSVVIQLPRTLLQYVLQCTNRIREYSVLVVVEKVVYAGLTAAVLLLGNRGFAAVAIADLAGKLFSLAFAVYYCRDILQTKPEGLSLAVKEAVYNISVGIQLMLANIASLLIIGMVRMAVEDQWDVTTFGKLSLTMSISNLLMIFIRAVALVMFPMLRRTEPDKLATIYSTVRSGLMIPLLGMLVFYQPLVAVVSAWLPRYADSLRYMALLFPMCIFESKSSMLIETYLKALRKEKWVMAVNVTTLALSACLTLITVYVLCNLDLAVVSIVLLLAFKCVLAEALLSRKLAVGVAGDIAQELILVALFMTASWFVGGWKGMGIYAAGYAVYLLLHRKKMQTLFGIVLGKVRK